MSSSQGVRGKESARQHNTHGYKSGQWHALVVRREFSFNRTMAPFVPGRGLRFSRGALRSFTASLTTACLEKEAALSSLQPEMRTYNDGRAGSGRATHQKHQAGGKRRPPVATLRLIGRLNRVANRHLYTYGVPLWHAEPIFVPFL